MDDVDDGNAGLPPGGKLGRYSLVRRLGKGGMGEVFLAKSSGTRGFEKQVAIKRILPQYSSNKHVVNMLVDEARICVLLNHPNIVQVMELDEDQGSHFIVMEYVDGYALSRLIRRIRKRGERLDPLIASFILINVLEGLHAAHTQRDNNGDLAGIIHRDVSPQNVLLSMTGQIKVIDFGIARARDRLEATQGSQVKGKLRYMAPEQIKPSLAGSAGIDHRVDVFAGGVVLFEMLAMRQRFPQSGDLEIIDAILGEETPDLRGAPEDGGIDDELQEILEQALAKERKRRFKDAAAFAGALRGYLYARDPSFTAERLARLMRRAFTDEEVDEADEPPPPAPVVKKGKVTVKPLPRAQPQPPAPEPQDEETRTQMRPRPVADEEPPARRKKKGGIPAPIVGAVIGAVFLVVVGLGVRSAMKPQQLPVDGVAVTSTPTNSDTNTTTNSTAPPATDAVPPPDNAKGLVDLGGGLEMIVEVDPATARISLAYQPDPKYVSPARLKVQRGETVDLMFEAEGYETLRKAFIAEGENLHFGVKLTPIPVPLMIRPVPRDAEVLVNGAPWTNGKVNPGDTLVINFRHPFYVEKTVTVTAQPAQPLVVDVTLDEKPAVDPNAPVEPAAGDDVDRGLDKLVKVTKKQKVATGVLVVSTPLYADVFIDGKKLAASTPVRETLSAGSHKVTVRGKAAEKTFTVDIVGGQTLRKTIALE